MNEPYYYPSYPPTTALFVLPIIESSPYDSILSMCSTCIFILLFSLFSIIQEVIINRPFNYFILFFTFSYHHVVVVYAINCSGCDDIDFKSLIAN